MRISDWSSDVCSSDLALRLGQAVTRVQQLGLAAAFGGIALVAFGSGEDVADLARTTPTGALLVLLSALTIAFYYVWCVELTARHGTVTVAAWSTLAGFIALLPFTAWELGHTSFRIEPEAVAGANYPGLLVTVSGLGLWLWVRRPVPTRVADDVTVQQPILDIAGSAAF